MAIRVEDIDTAPTLVAGDDGARSLPEAAPIREPRDWRLPYERERARAERERARAEEAQARAEELRWAEVVARCDAGSWKSRFEASRRKLNAAVEQAKEARRAAKDALSLEAEVSRLRRAAKASQSRVETLEAQLAKLRATRAVLSKALFGRKSEKRETPRSGRRRGQRRGAPGHGRTRRPGLEERTEEHNPPADARACSCCGRPYAAVGAEVSTLVEIEVRAHKRVIRRPRWRRTCDCASSPAEVSALPAPRLFANTPYGTSVWSRFLYERYLLPAPESRIGLAVRPGAAGLRGHAGRRRAALRAPVRPGGRGDPGAPERGNAAPCRRDHVARAGASRRGAVGPRLAVDLGQRRCGLLPHRPFAQRRGGAEAVRRGHAAHGPRLRPLQRLQKRLETLTQSLKSTAPYRHDRTVTSVPGTTFELGKYLIESK